MADEEYGSYGYNRARDDEEEEHRPSYGESESASGMSGRCRKDSDRTMDEPDPVVPTEGYSLESTYGKKTDGDDSKPSLYGQGSSFHKPSNPVVGVGTMDEPDPVVPTQGYNIEDIYGSGKFSKTDAADSEETSAYGRKPTGYTQSGAGSYKKPAEGATMDEPDPAEPTQGYCIDSTYGSGRKKTEDPESTGYGSGKNEDDESEETSEYGGRKKTPYGRKNDEDSEQVSGYGGRKTSYREESEESTGAYGRPVKSSSAYGTDEAETVVPTQGYNLESTYGVEGDESRKATGYRSKKDDEDSEDEDRKPKYGRKKHGEDDEESGYTRPSYGRQESSDSGDEEKKSSYKKHGKREGDDDDEDSEQSGRSKYGAARYGRNDDEDLVSSTAGLSLDSEGYSRGDSENRRRSDDDDDDNRRGKHGHRYRKHNDDED